MTGEQTNDRANAGLRARLKEEARGIRDEVRESVRTYVGAGLGFVVGLAWNGAISGLIQYAFPSAGNGILAKFIYAIALTVLATIGIIALGRLFGKKSAGGN